jgi:pyruvate-formate lyase
MLGQNLSRRNADPNQFLKDLLNGAKTRKVHHVAVNVIDSTDFINRARKAHSHGILIDL